MMKSNIIIMGVSGSGKTTIGKKLSKQLHLPFYDADDFHPEANKEIMAAGTPLDDADREPWLLHLRDLLTTHQQPIVLACSALKATYRDILDPNKAVRWIYLHGSEEVLRERLEGRAGHFVKADLLTSQLDTLEEPKEALKIDIDQSEEEIINEILGYLG